MTELRPPLFLPASGGCADPVMGVVICDLGNIAANASAVVTITVRPTEAAATAGTITNSATARARNASPTVPVTETTTVTPNLELTKTDDPDPVREDGLLAYTLTVENEGDAEAEDVVIRDELPDSVTFVRAFATDGGRCERNGDIVRCDRFNDPVTADDPVSATILVVPLEEGTITNEASVFAEGERRAIDTDTEDTLVESENDPNTPNDPNDPSNPNDPFDPNDPLNPFDPDSPNGPLDPFDPDIDDDGIPDAIDQDIEEDEEDENGEEDENVSTTSTTDEDCIDTTSETNTPDDAGADDAGADDVDTSETGSSETASLERIDFRTVAFQTATDPEDPEEDPAATDQDDTTTDECEDEGNGGSGVSANAGDGEAEATTPGAEASAGGDPDEQTLTEEPLGDVQDEIPTSGPLPNTDGFSLVILALSTALSIGGLLAFWLVALRRAVA